MSDPFLPVDPINIAIGAVSTEFQLVNGSSGTKTYWFLCTVPCHIRRGFSDVSAATTDDFRMPSTPPEFFRLAPGEGVRVIQTSTAGTLQIGEVDV